MAELGISNEQEVADIAIDLFSHCLAKVVTREEPYCMDLDHIHRISPVAIKRLRLAGPAWTSSVFTGFMVDRPAKGRGPLTLEFRGERFAAMQKWKNRLGLNAEFEVLENAVTILRCAVTAKKNGDAIMVYKLHSELHARISHDSSIMHTDPLLPIEASLPN
jgi:hypothetical protein